MTRLLAGFAFGCALAQAAELRGRIVENRLGGPPVSGVRVSAEGANPTVTSADGRFLLRFDSLNAGDKIVLAVGKPGHEVVNGRKWRPSSFRQILSPIRSR